MITSKTNEFIKHIKSLSQRKIRDEYNEFIVEGIKMVREAIENNVTIKKIVISEELFSEQIDLKNNDVEYVSKNVFDYISETQTPQGIMAIVAKLSKEHEFGDTIFALDNVQDPGNLGTIIRTLDCAGINTLLLSEGCVDAYNSKVIRSTMGAIFRVNVFQNVLLESKLKELKEIGYNVAVTTLDGATNLYKQDFDGKNIVVIGNESNGVSKEIQEIANIKIKIPMLGKTESLNAGVAASLVAYEIQRKYMI